MVRQLLSGLALGVLFVASASAQTAADIVARNLEAKGGIDKIKSINSVRITGTMSMVPGPEVAFVREQKRPSSIRMEIKVQGQTVVQAYDGKIGWILNPMAGRPDPERMPAEALQQISQNADFDGPLVDYKAKGSTLELLGREKVDGIDAYKLKLTLRNGDTLLVYVDAQRFLEVRIDAKMKANGTEMESRTTIGDYRDVAGIQVAHLMEQSSRQMPQKQRLTFQKVEVNPAIDDERFRMPSGR